MISFYYGLQGVDFNFYFIVLAVLLQQNLYMFQKQFPNSISLAISQALCLSFNHIPLFYPQLQQQGIAELFSLCYQLAIRFLKIINSLINTSYICQQPKHDESKAKKLNKQQLKSSHNIIKIYQILIKRSTLKNHPPVIQPSSTFFSALIIKNPIFSTLSSSFSLEYDKWVHGQQAEGVYNIKNFPTNQPLCIKYCPYYDIIDFIILIFIQSLILPFYCIIIKIESNIRAEMQNIPVLLSLSNSNNKLKLLFPHDPRADLTIIFKSRKFHLQKAYLRLWSTFFQKYLAPNQSQLVIYENFDELAFSNVLSLVYGNSLEVRRSQIAKYYTIAKFLAIQEVISLIRNDIINDISKYSIFTVLQIAQENADQQLFQASISQLQTENFTQIQRQMEGLMNLSINLFKLVVKAYNKHILQYNNGSYGLRIYKIIQKYCESHTYDQNKLEEMSFQMLDIKKLTSEEFSEIFMKNNQQSLGRNSSDLRASLRLMKSLSLKDSSLKRTESSSFEPSITNQSVFLDSIYEGNRSMQRLKIQNIYLRKKIKELQQQNQYLSNQLKQLLEISVQHQNTQRQLQANFKQINEELMNQIQKKQEFEKYHKKTIKRCEEIIEKLYKELDRKHEQINQFAKTYSLKMSKKHERDKENSLEQAQLRRGKIIPATEVHNMFLHLGERSSNSLSKKPDPFPLKLRSKTPTKYSERGSAYKLKKSESFTHQIQFDQQPVSISKNIITQLCQLIIFENFSKKRLKLLFRRSPFRLSQGKREDIFQRNPIAILIRTMGGQEIGCYIRISIPHTLKFCGQDRESFVFSLTDGKKINFKDVRGCKIQVTNQYFLSFGHVLKISAAPEKGINFICWSVNQAERSTSQEQFQIQSIQVYEINDVDIKMDI